MIWSQKFKFNSKMNRYINLSFLLLIINLCVYAQPHEHNRIKILSYNVLYGLQKDSTNIDNYKKLIAKLKPNIVATQEMNGWTQKSLEQLAHSYGHPYALQSKEEGFPVALTAQYPLVNFKKVTENMWHSFIYAKVEGLHIFVIHFSPFSYKKRLEEVETIIAHTYDIPSTEPILIMGDFNSLYELDTKYYGDKILKSALDQEEKHVHIRNLNNGRLDYSVLNKLTKAGFKDAFGLKNLDFMSTIPTYKDGNGVIKATLEGNPRRIDFIFLNETATKRLVSSTIIKDDLTHLISDHYPVFIELTK